MTLDQLRTFLWIARLGGVRRAAERMNVSQPAVSARIAGLEQSLKVKLFERGPRGVVLTKQGTSLLSYAEQMFFIHEEIRQRVASPEETEGLFRIGASETLAQAWLPRFLEAFTQAFPRVSVDLTVDISLNLRDALLDRRLDLAFLMGPVSDYSVENVALPDFDLHWYRGSGHWPDPVDFTAVPVISYARSTRPYRELVAEMARRHGPQVKVWSSASLSASIQMIAAGVAVGPYPRALAQDRVRTGQIEEFDPGWSPNPLSFTASWLSQPHSFLSAEGARIAREIATQVIENSDHS